MGERTAISWTDHTFNPWWGCERVSPGCQNCYAEAFDRRVGGDHWGKHAERRMMSDTHWRQPLKWNRTAEQVGRPALVFCSSMADVFEDRPELAAPRARLWELIDDTPHLIWQLLTKRPQNVLGMVPATWWAPACNWPANVWIGTTVEDQRRADERLPILVEIPAPVRFVSVEPMLGPVDLDELPALEWVICGGESGGKRRPFDPDWARALRDECVTAGVPFFFKQTGALHPGAPGPDYLETYKQFPIDREAPR